MAPERHLDDLTLTDVLDGRADAAAEAHAASCQSCTTRVARLRTVADLVGAPPPPATADEIDRVIDAALIAAPRPTSIPGGPRDGSGRRWAAAAARPLAAAAALLLVVATGLGIARLAGTTGEDTSATDAVSGSAVPEADAGTAAGDLGDLGDLDASTDLLAVVAARSPSTTPPDQRASASESAGARPLLCAGDPLLTDPSFGSVVATGTATWAGVAAEVYSVRRTDATSTTDRVLVLATDDCRVLALESAVTSAD